MNIALSKSEIVQLIVRKIKTDFSKLRKPDYELPADSHIENTAKQIYELVVKNCALTLEEFYKENPASPDFDRAAMFQDGFHSGIGNSIRKLKECC